MAKVQTLWFNLNGKLKSFIRSKIKEEAVVDDILQEVFITIHEKMDTLKDDTKLQAWIYQIARNKITDYYRKLELETKKIAEINKIDTEDAIPEIMEEAVSDMINMMDKLPSEYCEALCLTELKGLSQKEYAEKIGISYSGAKSRVQRARAMLKDMMMQCCHYQFDNYGTVISISPIPCCSCCSKQD